MKSFAAMVLLLILFLSELQGSPIDDTLSSTTAAYYGTECNASSPECQPDRMICGCNDERCRYFGSKCQMEAYNNCSKEGLSIISCV